MSLSSFFKKSDSRSASQIARDKFYYYLPIAKWLPQYDVQRNLVYDVAAGITVAGRIAGPETYFGLFELVDHIVSWPVRWPKGARGTPARRRRPAPKRG